MSQTQLVIQGLGAPRTLVIKGFFDDLGLPRSIDLYVYPTENRRLLQEHNMQVYNLKPVVISDNVMFLHACQDELAVYAELNTRGAAEHGPVRFDQ